MANDNFFYLLYFFTRDISMRTVGDVLSLKTINFSKLSIIRKTFVFKSKISNDEEIQTEPHADPERDNVSSTQ